MSKQTSFQKIFNDVFNDENQASTSAAVSDISQKLTTISLSSTSNEPQGNQTLLLWNILQLPPVNASERLKKELDPMIVGKAIFFLSTITVGEATILTSNDNTILMKILSDTKQFAKKKELMVALVESLKHTPGFLEKKNKDDVNALVLAALNYPHMPFIFGYLAAVMLQKGIDINEKLNFSENTLLHTIVAQGDSHVKVLEEMLTLLRNNPAFNISSCNHCGQTALHIAIKEHGSKGIHTIRLLLENGAHLNSKDIMGKETPLHYSIIHYDIELMKVLLEYAKSAIMNEQNRNGDTVLHKAVIHPVTASVTIEKQMVICQLLIKAGASNDVLNKRKKTPLDYVSLENKTIFKKIFYGKKKKHIITINRHI